MAKEVETKKGADVVDKKLIDEAVAFINETAIKSVYQGSIEIGEYILKKFFDNDIKLASSRNPKKQTSFNALCARDDLSLDPTSLSGMVRVASQERFLSEKNVDTASLTYTHKKSLIKLENGNEKIKLIKSCIKGNWSTRFLDEKIREKIDEDISNRSPSLIQTTKRYIGQVTKTLETINISELETDDETLNKMSANRRKKLVNNLKELKTKFEKISEISKDIPFSCDDLLNELTAIEKKPKKNQPKPGVVHKGKKSKLLRRDRS